MTSYISALHVVQTSCFIILCGYQGLGKLAHSSHRQIVKVDWNLETTQKYTDIDTVLYNPIQSINLVLRIGIDF